MNPAMTVPRTVMRQCSGSFFKSEPTLSLDNPAWMTLTNASVQYVAATSARKDGASAGQADALCLLLWNVPFLDLFEGLCVGHAPKKCPICGRWFLTIDARHTNTAADWPREISGDGRAGKLAI